MRLGLIHPDPAMAKALGAAAALVSSPSMVLDWSDQSVAAAQRRPVPELLLLAASHCTPALVRDWIARGCAVAVLVPENGTCTDAVYAALDAGALGHAVVPDGSALPALMRRVQRWAALLPTRKRPPLPPLIAIGASAGGPQALQQLLAGFDPGLSAAVVVALHYAGEPATELARWLQQTCRLPVAVAGAGDAPVAGRVVVADAGGHLELADSGGWQWTPARASDPVCPSIDRLFHSLVRHPAVGAAAVLTGMGQDGAAGLLALRQAGWFTVAQDADSSRVYGMPRAAAEAGAAAKVLPLVQIAGALTRAVALECS